MTLLHNVRDEFQRTPVAVLAGSIAALTAILSLAVAWVQFRQAASTVTAGATSSQPEEVSAANILLLIAFVLGSTISSAAVLRIAARKHDIAAFFASIPLMALVNFVTIWLMYLTPPRQRSIEMFSSAHDTVLVGTTAILIAFCGVPVLRDLAQVSGGDEKREGESEEEARKRRGGASVGFVVLSLLVLALWTWLVFAGQTRLTRTLLPPITHYVDKTPDKKGT